MIHHFEGAPDASVSQPPPAPVTDFSIVPNPASERIQVNYSLNKRSAVKIEILDLLGANVMTEYSDTEDQGHHTKAFDLSSLATGSYFIRVWINGAASVKAVKLIR